MLIGIVGKTNTGKSTFFKAATLAEIEIANRPFVTIKPHHGCGFVKIKAVADEFKVKPNPKFGYYLNGYRFVPVDLLDVAGLIPGAHKGLGLGNQFLDDLRQADVLVHVIDASGSSNEVGEPAPPGSYDPANDIKFLEEEIDFWFLGILKKGWERFAKQMQQEHKDIVREIAKQFSGLKITEDIVKDAVKKLNLPVDKVINWTEDNLLEFSRELRKASKPMIIAANKADVEGADKNIEKLKKEFPDYIIIPCSAESELALREAAKHDLISYVPGENDFKTTVDDKLNAQQKKGLEFIKKNVLKKYKNTGVQEVLDKAVFELLKYIAVYPVATSKLEDKDGNKLPDCHLVPEETTALEFAYRVHSDIGDNFVRAIDLKTKKVIGKDSEVKHRDVIEIVTSK